MFTRNTQIHAGALSAVNSGTMTRKEE